jgi:prepilin-type N-terminal cleavage/methylation domain-containing protein
MSTYRPSTARAFTLVEMLVVLGIIGVLVALLLPAINAARRNALNASIAFEIKALDQAFETYKQQRGEYPPCFGDYNASGTLDDYGTAARNSTAVERHLQRCYPKFTNPMMKSDFYNAAKHVDQAEALVMWLSRISTAPGNPFDLTITASRHGYYEFDERRLIEHPDDRVPLITGPDFIPYYISKYSRETPYIYIENRNYDELSLAANPAKVLMADRRTETMMPYASSEVMNPYMNKSRFQILSTGLDGEWGAPGPKLFPAGTGYQPGDRDNLTNFSEGRTLGDSRPQ